MLLEGLGGLLEVDLDLLDHDLLHARVIGEGSDLIVKGKKTWLRCERVVAATNMSVVRGIILEWSDFRL